MSLELGVMPCLEEGSVIVPLLFLGGVGACIDAKVEGLEFEDLDPKMDV
jgi:hypothetical protein